MTAEDPSVFAEQVASANGIGLAARTPAILTNSSLITTGLIGGAVGAIFAWYFVYPVATRIPDFSGMSELTYAVLVHSVAATVVLSAALTAMWWRFRHDTTIGRTIAFAGPLVLLAGAASIAPTVAFASLSNYSTDPLVVLTEFTIVGGFVAAALVLARRLARRPKQPPFGVQHRPAS